MCVLVFAFRSVRIRVCVIAKIVNVCVHVCVNVCVHACVYVAVRLCARDEQ